MERTTGDDGGPADLCVRDTWRVRHGRVLTMNLRQVAMGTAQHDVTVRRVPRGNQGQDWRHREGEGVDDEEQRLETEGTGGHRLCIRRLRRRLRTGRRPLGQVVLALPIGSEACGYNEDWVTIEVDASNFTANALHFCAPHFSNDFSFKMLAIIPKYTQSAEGLLLLNHVLPDEALRHAMVVC